MGKLVIAALLLLGTAGVAQANPSVYKLDVNFQRIVHNADPMAYEIAHEDWTTAWQVETGVEVGRYFLEPQFHLESAYSKVMTAGLFFRQGFRLTDWLDLSWAHHSRHLLDRKSATVSEKRYPLWDSVDLNFHFIPDVRRGRR